MSRMLVEGIVQRMHRCRPGGPARWWLLLVLALLLALPLVTGRQRGEHARAQSASPLITVAFGPSQVFGASPVDLLRQCPAEPGAARGSATCVAQVLQQEGASPDAIAFYQLTGHVLTDFQPYGVVNLGTVIHDIWCCSADTPDLEPVLLGGVPATVYPLAGAAALPLARYRGINAARAAFTNLSKAGLGGFELESVTASPEGGQRFTFDMRLINVCRACGTGYVARTAFDFGVNGSYLGATPLDIVCSGGAQSPCGRMGP